MDTNFPVSVYYQDLDDLGSSNISWHWHEEIELLIINGGEVEIFVEGGSVSLLPGQGAVIFQNVMHAIRPNGKQKASLYSVRFHPSFIFGEKPEGMFRTYLEALSTHGAKVQLLDEDTAWQSKTLDLINDLIVTNLTRRFGYELTTKGILCSLWALLAQNLKQEVAETKVPISPDEQRVKDATDYIQKHFTDSISLDDIAESIHISKSECCRCFKRTLQMTPFEYLMKYRISEAARKLHELNAPIDSMAEIALSVGFNNISYFNKLFRKYMGCTPSAYRKNVQLEAAINGTGVFGFSKDDKH